MADNFPDISSKLGAPTKKSLFERQKADAEAKRAREKAETAAVYETFVKSFDDNGDAEPSHEHASGRLASGAGISGSGGPFGGASAGGPGKRHFTSTGLKSGPGSLGKNGPGSFGPPQTAFSRKRPYDDYQSGRRDRDRRHGMFSYDDEHPALNSREPADTASAFRAEDDDDPSGSGEAKVAAKPTLHLSSLPPGTSPAVIKALIPSILAVENVRILPPSAPNSAHSSSIDRKSTSAIVTLASETPATDIDTIVSQLQNQYLGFGFSLSISRHLSSAALSGSTAITAPATAGLTNLPFGARPIPQHTSLSRAPPPGQGRFAPPQSYTSSTPYSSRNRPATQVVVQTPADLKQLKLIHKTLEALLTYGPEFEALLMSRPSIQQDEQWAWLWNSRSAGGVYYRWRLWDILTDSGNRRQRQGRSIYGLGSGSGEEIFAHSAPWVPPEQNLKFEYTTYMDEFISDPDYNSSDEEDNEGGLSRRYNDHITTTGGPPAEGVADTNTDGVGYLNPLAKAKLVHLLARLPESNAKLRKGDIARVTAFAIEHAGSGADEVVEIVVGNVEKPLTHSAANKEKNTNSDRDDRDGDEKDMDREKEKVDTTPASLVGLFVISDILSSSSTSGVRHAWRYRSLFETVLKKQKVFESLGRVDKEQGWGRLKAEKWKRSVQAVLSLWEGWCVFPQSSQDAFVQNFVSPPLSEKEKDAVEKEEMVKREEELRRTKNNNKWRSLNEDGPAVAADLSKETEQDDQMMEDVDGEAMVDDELDGEVMEGDGDASGGEDIDGWPMEDSSDEDAGGNRPSASEEDSRGYAPLAPPQGQISPPTKRQRPKAIDMFADDSDGE